VDRKWCLKGQRRAKLEEGFGEKQKLAKTSSKKDSRYPRCDSIRYCECLLCTDPIYNQERKSPPASQVYARIDRKVTPDAR
jgi:hypothetical protein